MTEPKTLYVVATPIGNIQDWSPRAIETLNNVDLIFAEDTQHSAPLLNLNGIKTPMRTLHDHNEKEFSQWVIDFLLEGKSAAIISDAGTPLISDPGYYLTALCHQAEIKVVPIPGCSAVITALSASGLPTDTFTFFGFLPAKPKQRKEKYASILNSEATSIFYESPHRIIDSVKDLISELGEERELCIARELTKQFETILKGSAKEILEYLEADANHRKGEFVLMVAKGESLTTSFDVKLGELAKELAKVIKSKEVAKIIAKVYNLDKTEIYNFLSKK